MSWQVDYFSHWLGYVYPARQFKSSRQAIASKSNDRTAFLKIYLMVSAELRAHIGFMRIGDLFARCVFPEDGNSKATRK